MNGVSNTMGMNNNPNIQQGLTSGMAIQMQQQAAASNWFVPSKYSHHDISMAIGEKCEFEQESYWGRSSNNEGPALRRSLNNGIIREIKKPNPSIYFMGSVIMEPINNNVLIEINMNLITSIPTIDKLKETSSLYKLINEMEIIPLYVGSAYTTLSVNNIQAAINKLINYAP